MAKHEWTHYSDEHLIELALKELGADDHLKNAVSTKVLTEQLALMGCPGDEIKRAARFTRIASFSKGVGGRDPFSDKSRLWRGSRWTGVGGTSEPWNQHQWALPLWLYAE